MKRVFKNVILIILLGLSFAIFRMEAQVMTSDDFASRLKKYLEARPWEELYLHLDRNKYIAGEDIWFSIYAISRETGRLSARSALAYVELLNPWNIPVIRKRFQLEGGRGEGSFQLPDSLSSGFYTIRAYTGGMKEFLPENCNMQDIEIYNPFSQSDFRKRANFSGTGHNSFNIRFYPEGGNLLSGANNRVVAHCFNENGAGIRFSGIITDNKEDSIASLKTDETGYGSFFIIPESGKDYSIISAEGSFTLPDAISDGFSVALDNSFNDRVEILFTAEGKDILRTALNYFLTIHTRGNIDYMADLRISETVTKITLPRNRLRGGIANVALIREDGKIMFERLFYSPGQKPLSVNLTSDTLYGWRQKISVNLAAVYEGRLLINDLSISVAPAAASDHSQGIGDFLIFGTEYGTVPPMLLQNLVSPQANDLIDNMLICSESRWIRWQDIVSEDYQPSQYNFEQHGHNLAARIRYREDKTTGNADILYMSMRGKIADFRYARRDSDGRFNFILPVDTVMRNLIIQPGFADNNMILELEPSFSRQLPGSYNYKTIPSDSLARLFSGLSFNYQAARIYGTRYKKETGSVDAINEKSRRFYGIPEMEVFLDDYISLPQMLEVFTELLPGIILRPAKSGWEIKITNPVTGVYYVEPPLVMIDGLIINDLTILADLDPELLEKIEVVRTPYLIGDLVLHGIVNVITRSGDFSNVTLSDYAVELPYRVVDKTPLFTAPDYSAIDKMPGRIPDLRNTLYWNPSVKPGEGGETRIEFWSPDYSETWIVTINGITNEGEPVTVRKTFRTELINR